MNPVCNVVGSDSGQSHPGSRTILCFDKAKEDRRALNQEEVWASVEAEQSSWVVDKIGASCRAQAHTGRAVEGQAPSHLVCSLGRL